MKLAIDTGGGEAPGPNAVGVQRRELAREVGITAQTRGITFGG